ncbi:amidase [candidate division KSB3 bacterium]|uniref:Amidase n=1 Tax=candidate division KSB3 bacterium TaxID=2044937 RepID=A0A2G6K7N6_9BACT|nr:MAG: amidase [candidate division KSB3 bacterium]
MYIIDAPLATIAKALRSGELELHDFINELCDRIDANEPQIQALVTETNRRERLMNDAEALASRYPDPQSRPPLYGVPIGVKDIFRVDGFPTHAGSALPPELFEGREAACVTLLKQAGALIAGKTVTTEFAYFEPGPTHNPYNLEHTPGGSSSGSAAGVACGFFPLAFGTQTIGSVIRPAAFCGVVGFKPSFDRIPTEGLIYFSRSADHVGIFTQDVAGTELAASLLIDDWQAVSVSGKPVLGVPEGEYLAQTTKDGLEAFEKELLALNNAGYEVKRIPIFDKIDELNERHRRMTAAEAAQEHAEWFAAYHELYRPRTAEVVLKGQQISSQELESARKARFELRDDIAKQQEAAGIDLWISPAATGEAPKGLHATGDPDMNLPWTNAGLPAITVPAGLSKNNLPLGLQCIAGFRQDERLIAWAKHIVDAFL